MVTKKSLIYVNSGVLYRQIYSKCVWAKQMTIKIIYVKIGQDMKWWMERIKCTLQMFKIY